MPRYQTALAAILLLLIALLIVRKMHDPFGASVSVASAQSSRPNIIVIMTDDQDKASMSVLPKVQSLIGAQGVSG